MKYNLVKSPIKMVAGILALSLVLSFQNCSKARFASEVSSSALNSLTGNSGGNDPSCGTNSVTENKIVKVLFIMDTSGSNEGSFFSEGTDPNKKWRSATFNNFIDQYKSKSNFYYGLITFQGVEARAQIKVNGVAGFTNDMAVVNSGYNSFMSTTDYDATPYKAALGMAATMIKGDLAVNASQKASYVVVMVSDGQATDYQSPDDVIPDVQAIVDLAPNQISLNGVYYYSSVLKDSETTYLKNISKVGGGSFITANSNQVLSINDVIQIPSSGCP
jgi:hypothetical protein